MLYITKSQTQHNKLYSLRVDVTKNTMYAVPYQPAAYYFLCIVDLDELDACALALKGIPLFKCTVELAPGNFYDLHTPDRNAVYDLWYNMLLE